MAIWILGLFLANLTALRPSPFEPRNSTHRSLELRVAPRRSVTAMCGKEDASSEQLRKSMTELHGVLQHGSGLSVQAKNQHNMVL